MYPRIRLRIMAQQTVVEVPYFQGIWRHATQTSKPLREQIEVRHPMVLDQSPDQFWETYRTKTTAYFSENPTTTTIDFVALIAGSLERDRIGETSCAWYSFP
jgi:hypothetical protein